MAQHSQDPPVVDEQLLARPLKVKRPQNRMNMNSNQSQNLVMQALSVQGMQGAPMPAIQAPQSVQSRPSSRINNQRKTTEKTESAGAIHNVVTKFSFATKGGISMHNPYK
jgi:hypothetical protein